MSHAVCIKVRWYECKGRPSPSVWAIAYENLPDATKGHMLF
jgi:hypothetical protein